MPRETAQCAGEKRPAGTPFIATRGPPLGLTPDLGVPASVVVDAFAFRPPLGPCRKERAFSHGGVSAACLRRALGVISAASRRYLGELRTARCSSRWTTPSTTPLSSLSLIWSSSFRRSTSDMFVWCCFVCASLAVFASPTSRRSFSSSSSACEIYPRSRRDAQPICTAEIVPRSRRDRAEVAPRSRLLVTFPQPGVVVERRGVEEATLHRRQLGACGDARRSVVQVVPSAHGYGQADWFMKCLPKVDRSVVSITGSSGSIAAPASSRAASGSIVSASSTCARE